MIYQKPYLFLVGVLFLGTALLTTACDAEQPSDVSVESSSEAMVETSQETASPSSETAEAPSPALDFQLDTAAILKIRVLGDENAPIKITEFSSFTCPHCATFHENTYKELKEKYIDTGKASLAFSDFPLNLPAMHASLAARCLPDQGRYFEFVDVLYADQKAWAFEPQYKELLKAKAAEFGLAGAQFDACVDNEDLQTALLKKMREMQTLHGINSTPSFVVNNKEVVKGATHIGAFEAVFEKFKAETE